MRLINTNTLQLEDFPSGKVPPYAILSHTWENGEISFQTWSSPWQWLLRTRDNKITHACRLAKSYKLGYVWIDTCCIDKTDSVELGEAINSMFRWYQNASICFVYLSDLPAVADFETGFAFCRWHTRGWTLPELIAPSKVEFYDQEWHPRGTKQNHKRLLEKHTRIPAAVLTGEQQLEACSVSDRLSWASSRKTTKPEDAAYCLLGIFGVHMPLIYGEGHEAFYRLQETIKRKYQHKSESTSLRARQQQQMAIQWPAHAPHTLTLRVPSELVISRYKSDSYPSNLLDSKNNFAQPAIHRDRLQDAMSQLCTDDPFSVKIGFADLVTGPYRKEYLC
ncbi:hypothetical protein PV08_02423 [Exophiala spinifera]|uniref:Heterokaryon incompatibility domain-containing protein n=1 Tax=Exophiala spinifera TaxID=91928 RepID=A0A0D2BHN9_9EURO|nr:uncharacterized protein PV08_02423 [Exophiala spinifera]KIW18135.1 hypothetical protein PV08_02423 [Exophiala spinifera]